MHNTKAKSNGNIRLPPRRARGQKADAYMNHAVAEHILSRRIVSMLDAL
jgi:hypothetical protein